MSKLRDTARGDTFFIKAVVFYFDLSRPFGISIARSDVDVRGVDTDEKRQRYFVRIRLSSPPLALLRDIDTIRTRNLFLRGISVRCTPPIAISAGALCYTNNDILVIM